MEARRLDRTIRVYALETTRGSSGSKRTAFADNPFMTCKAERNDYHRDRMREMIENDKRTAERVTTWRLRYSVGRLINATMLIKDEDDVEYEIINISEVGVDGKTRRTLRRKGFIDVMTEVKK